MNSKRISAVLLLTIIFLVPFLLFATPIDWERELVTGPETLQDGSFVQSVDSFIRRRMPRREFLQQLAISMRFHGGQMEQNGVFITDNMLIKNVEPANEDYVDANVEAILTFAEETRRPTYFMLIPTACAIEQEELPEPVVETLFNQKSFIETTYEAFHGSVSLVDLYPQLFAKRQEYIFYRTQSNLTSLGGYYVYTSLGNRLGLSPLKGLDQFNVEYATNAYYGDIYEQCPYQEVPADVLALYRFSKYRREYQVTHYEGDGGQKTYYTLYPTSQAVLTQNQFDRFLGGLSPVVDIQVSAGSSDSLLLFCDETALSYLPFLATHYSRITLVDLKTADDHHLSQLRSKEYSQVLFAYSVDTFSHSTEVASVRAVR